MSNLEGRTSAVHSNYPTSTPKPTASALPQGALLSTTLSSLYLSDMPHPSPTPLALLSQSWRPYTVSCRLSHAVTTLLKHFSTCKLPLNTHKTEAVLFSQRRPPSRTLLISMTPWTLGFGSALFRPCAGLKMSDTQQHLHTDANKAKTVLCNVYPLLARNSTLTPLSKLALYKLLIRSILNFAALVCSSTCPSNCSRLPVKQSKCLRIIGSYPRRPPLPTCTTL